MVTYPIHVRRKHYNGSKDHLRRRCARTNQTAAELERYLNRRIEESDQETQVFLYGFIAADTGIAEEEVRRLLFPVDCGHNGLTVRKPARAGMNPLHES